jgi:hypothetical protein
MDYFHYEPAAALGQGGREKDKPQGIFNFKPH